ncbi:MAG: SCO family protein [Alphaproteobacteria bacterium]
MLTWRRALWLGTLLAVVAVGVAGFLIYRNTQIQASSPPTLGAPFSLIDSDGQPITEAAFAGRPTALFFGFTHCPEICPVSLFEVSTLMDELGAEKRDLQAFFISVDPERDTPELMGSFIAPFRDNIRGITGPLPDIEALAGSWGVYIKKVPLDDGDYTVDHTASVILVDRKGRFRGTIAYRENHQTALDKLRLLVSL